MGMTKSIGESFDQSELTLKPNFVRNGSILKLLKPGQQVPEGLRVAGSFKLAGLMVTQSVAENNRPYLNNRPKPGSVKDNFLGDFISRSVYGRFLRFYYGFLSETEARQGQSPLTALADSAERD